MLSSILKEHQSSQQRRRELEETRRIEAVNATNKLSHALVDHLNTGVAQAYINQVRCQMLLWFRGYASEEVSLIYFFFQVRISVRGRFGPTVPSYF